MKKEWKNLREKMENGAYITGAVASDVVAGASSKATKLLEVAKLTRNQMDLQSSVQTALGEVGAMMYATHTGTPTNSDVLVEKLEEIDALNIEIVKLEQKITYLQARAVCTQCATPTKQKSVFCGECGARL